jgi:hypothetical protein
VRRAGASLLVVAAILLGALAAGSPVHGVETVSKRTAGIELSSATPAAPRAAASREATPIPQQLVQLLVVAAVLLAAVAGGGAAVRAKARSILRWQGSARRGPPALA